MQITVNRNDLAASVTWAMRGISSRPVLPILAQLRVIVADGRLTLEAFDYDMATRAHVFGDDAEAGDMLVCGKQLSDAVKAMPKGKTARVALTGDDAGLTLASGPASCKVARFGGAAGEYPALPEMPAYQGTVAGDAFGRSVARVAAAAGTDDTLPVLTCVAMELGDKITLAATDRYRLAVDTADWTPATAGGPGELASVPAKILAQFMKAAGGAGKIAIHFSVPDAPANERGFGGLSTLAGFATDERELIVHTSNGEFPRYQKLLPSATETTVTADAVTLLAAVKRADAVAQRAMPVRFEANGAIHLQVYNDGEVASDETVPAERTGPEITTAFNPGYLASMVAGVTGTVRIGFTAAGKPALITSASDDTDAFRGLVMPIRLGA